MFKKKRLNYLAIPNSGGKVQMERKKRAIEELNERPVENIIIMHGRDSEEDIIYLGKLVKRGDRVGIDTFPLHFKEYLELIKKAKRDKLFPKGVKVENVETSQDFKLFLYGELGYLEERLKSRKLCFIENRHEKLFSKIKNAVKKIISLG